jgi:UDP-glucose 4-epimerase
MQVMKILVTGGTGFIGSHTCVKLLEADHQVVIIDNLVNSKKEIVEKIEKLGKKNVEFYEGDIRDREPLEEIFTNHRIDAVIHFAGLKAVGESISIPLEYYDNNVNGSIQLLKVMKKFGCKKIVFSSSATVYGMNDNVPFKEDYPLSTTNPYGATKKMIEEIMQDLYVGDQDFSIALLRYFNPIGAHPSGLIGENPNGIPNNLLPYVAKVASGELEQLSVFGDDYDTIDGTGVRDYIHVQDLAAGHIAALDYVETHSGIEAFNLGTGEGYSVLQVVKAFEKASGKTVKYQIVDRRPGDIPTCYASTQKSENMLHWEAKLDLDTMCIDAWNYVQNGKKGNN